MLSPRTHNYRLLYFLFLFYSLLKRFLFAKNIVGDILKIIFKAIIIIYIIIINNSFFILKIIKKFLEFTVYKK